MRVYDFKIKTQDGREVSHSDYQGKVLLIVNTATGCWFTPQYNELQELYEAHQKDGLEILDFPCNQFGEQAPGSDEEIHDFCTGRYGITFPQFSKIDVNGENALPLFGWLTENTTFEDFDPEHPIGKILIQVMESLDANYKSSNSAKWSFTKFLIDRNGEIATRYEPTASMEEIKATIDSLL